MQNDAAGGGGQLSNRLPDNVEAALAAIRSYIAEERDALDSLKSVNGDRIAPDDCHKDAAELAKAALGLLVWDLANIAANKVERDNAKQAKTELQAELRAIDDKYGLEPGPRPYLANHKADVARRAQIASWQLKQELRAIDDKYGLEPGPRPYFANYKAKVARCAQIASWQLKQELRDIDNQHRVRAELQAELRGIDGKYELHKELRAIDYKYELQICLQRAHSAVAAADGSRYKLVAELGANHAAVKTVSACCNLARALVGLYGSVHTLTTLGRPETVVEDNAYATGLADQALLYALEAIFHLSDYQGRWVEDYSADAPGVFAAMAGVVMGDPSTFMTGVLTTPAQQAQGATR